MTKSNLNIVWLKRDLRTQDHDPLQVAETADEDYLIIYLIEPSHLEHPDFALRHLQFCYHSVKDMNERLTPYGQQVHICYGEAVEIFKHLSEAYNIKQVLSYQESGTRATWVRDKAVSKIFEEKNIQWLQFQRDGILRGIANRINWDKRWYAQMEEVIIENTYSSSEHSIEDQQFKLPAELELQLENMPSAFQQAGESKAWQYLKSFCEGRGADYFKYISKPEQSRSSCGRISPYLAWGCISIRQAYQYVKTHPTRPQNKRAYKQFLTRLHWHCHFIQKFEVDCDYELLCVNPGYEALEYENNPQHLAAWKTGMTGVPLVDACMRCVITTGWINFRMRAMLVSFLCHHLDCDWREGVYHLAQQFLDYEPGIHFPQFQMQAGVTGVNTVRIYNPIKQSKDHDPEGVFIKKWVPELRPFPEAMVHEPWNLTILEKQFYNIDDSYPEPIIDITAAGQAARDKIWGHKKHPEVRKYRRKIIERHTRNRKFSKTAN